MTDRTKGTKEIVIKLTDKEREQIKRKTGEDITELMIGTMEACISSQDVEAPEAEHTEQTKQIL